MKFRFTRVSCIYLAMLYHTLLASPPTACPNHPLTSPFCPRHTNTTATISTTHLSDKDRCFLQSIQSFLYLVPWIFC